MRERSTLAVMIKIVAVQRGRRAVAEAELAAADAAQAAALGVEKEAIQHRCVAERAWLDHVLGSSFGPELGLAFSRELISRDDDADRAMLSARQSAELRARSQQHWQSQEAHVRLADASIRELKRKVARRADEARLSELADRLTYAWTRP